MTCAVCGVTVGSVRFVCSTCSGESSFTPAERQRMAERAIQATALAIGEAMKGAPAEVADVLQRTLVELGITTGEA